MRGAVCDHATSGGGAPAAKGAPREGHRTCRTTRTVDCWKDLDADMAASAQQLQKFLQDLKGIGPQDTGRATCALGRLSQSSAIPTSFVFPDDSCELPLCDFRARQGAFICLCVNFHLVCLGVSPSLSVEFCFACDVIIYSNPRNCGWV